MEELRILLLEDVAADAELIRYELRKAGLSFVSRCVDGKKAFLRELRERPPDLIIADFSLPEFNALDALSLLNAHRVNIPFILVTGSQSEEVAVECIKEGADDYILKSSLKRLPSALRGVLAKANAEKEKAAAENALRKSEEYFRTLIENSSDIISIIGEDWKIRYSSPSVQRFLGYEPAELTGGDVRDFVHSDNHALLLSLPGRAGAEPFEFQFRHKDGSWRCLEGVSKNLLHDPGVSGLVVNSRDITERKRAEEQVRGQAALLNKSPDAIVVTGLDGKIAFFNNRAEQLFGLTQQQAMGTPARSLFPASEGAFGEALEVCLKKGDWQGELKREAGGKNLLIESRWSVVKDSSGEPASILIINTDVTEKRRLESHFLRAQRMESIGTLAGGIAHDLNNVLTPILMSVRLLREELTEGSAQELLDTLESSAHRGAAIVQQVLSFARGVEGERSTFQVKHPLAEVIKIAKDVFPPLIHLRTKIDKELWMIHGDPTQLHQVFMNLLVNARDAMPHGGRLQVEAENTVIDENYARMQPEARPGPWVVISVSDTGTGIPPGLLGKIFEPFFTTKDPGKGTGLGLSTAAGIVKSHGGFITVYSEPGKGTCFKVHLPAAEASVETAPKAPPEQGPPGHGELVLVVDDELAIREIIKVTLEDNGYRVLTANDGTEAVALFAQHRTDIKVVIVDVMMPYMDGPATIRALQKFDPKARFIAISGLMENQKIAEIAETGTTRFLPKPFTTDQLLLVLDQALRPSA